MKHYLSTNAENLALKLFIALLLGFSFYLYVVDATPRALIDLSVYFQAGKSLNAGLNLYAEPFEGVDRWGRTIPLYYFYPPLLAWLLSKISFLDFFSVKVLWSLGSWICCVLSAYFLTGIVSGTWIEKYSRTSIFAAALFFLFCFEPIFWGISDGQVAALLLLFLTSALYCARLGKHAYCGVLLALAALIKISPVLLLLVPLRYKQWRTVCWFCLTVLVLSALTLFNPIGIQVWIDFVNSLFSMTAEYAPRGFVFNYAFDAALLMPFGLDQQPILRLAVKLSLLGFMAWTLLGFRGESRREELVLYAFMICLMMLLSPIMWFHHFTWIIIPILILLCFGLKNISLLEARLKHAVRCLGLYFLVSQANLIHYQALKFAPQLNQITILVPGACILLCAIWLKKALINLPK